jgi:hypothetical protein
LDKPAISKLPSQSSKVELFKEIHKSPTKTPRHARKIRSPTNTLMYARKVKDFEESSAMFVKAAQSKSRKTKM